MTSNTRGSSLLSLMVFVTGLAGAAASSVWTYRAFGLYGGPMTTGFHREWNPQSRTYQLVHETTTSAGLHIRRLVSDTLAVQRMDLSGEAVAPALQQLVTSGARVAFSSRNDGVMDAWAIRNLNGETARVEMATKRDGKIDRWEQYSKGQLVRVDLDTNGNGKPDQWMTYEDGILMDTFIDANEDGKADGPPAR